MVSGRHVVTAVATATALVVLAVPTTARQPADEAAAPPVGVEPTEEPTEEVAVAELAALEAARAAIAPRMVASAGAEGARRRAEEALVAAHGVVRDAEADLDHANALLEAAYEVEEDTDGNVVTDAFGTPVLVTDTVGQPLVKDEVRRGELVQYVGLMDAARQIAALVGYGPL